MAVTITPKKLAIVDASFMPDAVAAIYTPAAGVTAVIDKITVANTDASARTFTLWIGPSGVTPVAPGGPTDTGAASVIVKEESIAAGAIFTENRIRVIEDGMTLWAIASALDDLSFIVDGVEVSGTPDGGEAVVTSPTQLGQGIAVSGGDLVYTPADASRVGIVHTITVVNLDSIAHGFTVYSQFSASGRLFRGTLAAGARWVSPPGIHVIEFGNDLSISDDDGPPDVGLAFTIDGAERVTA